MNATATNDLNLRAGPGLDAAVLTVMPAGSRLAITGAATAGFYPVALGDQRGWAFGDFLALDAGGGGSAAFTTDDVNLRGGPSLADAPLRVLPAGTEVALTGEASNGFVAVDAAGTAGWVYAAYLDAGGGAAPGADVAKVTSDLNLRAGPSTGDDVLATMPAGATVTLLGDEANGFRAVRYGAVDGWAFGGWLTTEGGGAAVTTDAVNLRADPNLGADVLTELPPGTDLTLSGEGADGFHRVAAAGVEGWVFGAYLD